MPPQTTQQAAEPIAPQADAACIGPAAQRAMALMRLDVFERWRAGALPMFMVARDARRVAVASFEAPLL